MNPVWLRSDLWFHGGHWGTYHYCLVSIQYAGEEHWGIAQICAAPHQE